MHCQAHSLGLTVKVLAWMHSRYADEVDVTALKTEFLAVNQIFNDKTSHLDDSLRALEETASDNRLYFPNVILVIQLLLINLAANASPVRSFSASNLLEIKHDTVKIQCLILLLYSYKHLIGGLDMISVINNFVSFNSIRQKQFQTFIESILYLHFR